MDKETIETSDLYFAAYLHSIDCKIQKINREGKKNIFTFECNDPDSLNRNYFNSSEESAVPALKLANSIRSLKTMCYVK